MKVIDPMKISEKELRSALRSHITSELRDTDKIIEELGIENGAARIDLAVISDRICGYEIKSDFDNAMRLVNQIHSYNRVFENIWIVTGATSSITIDYLLPSWWGIIRALRSESGEVQLHEIRPPIKNNNRDVYSLLTLFKRDELNILAIKYAVAAKTIKGPKQSLIDTLASLISLDVVNQEATHALKSRIATVVVVQ